MVELPVTLKPVAAARYTMLVVGAPFLGVGLYAVLRRELLAGAILIAMGALFWQFVASLRIRLTADWLECRQFGFVRWRVRRGDVELKDGRAGDYGGFPAVIVYSRSKAARVGAISRMQFRPSQLNLLRASLEG